jgi:hypothetical protein
MAQLKRSRRRKAAFIAVPIAAFAVAFGALSVAWGFNGSKQSGCKGY